MRRPFALLCSTAVMLSLGVPAASADPSDWCSGGDPAPCIVSAFRDGMEIFETDSEWDFTVLPFSGAGSSEVHWNLWNTSSDPDLELGAGELGHVWTITIETGIAQPRVVFTRGQNVTVSRSGTQVTITASPVTVAGDCDPSSWPWTCPGSADPALDRDAYLGGDVTDYAAWNNAAQRNAFYGMDYDTNVDTTSLPPEIVNDPTTGEQRLLIRLANPHFRADGTTVFVGHAHLRIPNAFLKKVYGIDHPASLTGAGLAPSLGGSGSATVFQESSGQAMIVDITGMTFSRRKVLIKRGKITPVKPKNVRMKRRGSTAILRFDAVTSRGSRIKGYEGMCGKGPSADTGKSRKKRTVVKVKGLSAGKTTCRVRALSKAGPGRWARAR